MIVREVVCLFLHRKVNGQFNKMLSKCCPNHDEPPKWPLFTQNENPTKQTASMRSNQGVEALNAHLKHQITCFIVYSLAPFKIYWVLNNTD